VEFGLRRSDEGTKIKPKPDNTESPVKVPTERAVKDIRRVIRRHFSAEDKHRIVLEVLRSDDGITVSSSSEYHGCKVAISRHAGNKRS
jgi:transposase-like protein